jgi:type VI secretion system protein ImpM
MSATVVSLAPGWFGKMPSLGDFASRRLPDAFVEPWDRWLQGGLLQARGDIGDDWIEGYLVAPIRRFWIAPGLLGDAGWAGLLMPSVDRVGRHFPLTLAQPVESLRTALAAVDWYRALDATTRQVLDLQFTPDHLEAALSEIAAPSPDAAGEPHRRLAQRLCPGDACCSAWWCDDAGPDTAFLCAPGLPSSRALAAMWSRAA